MVRTIVSLDAELKRWLDCTARKAGVPTSRLIAEAVAEYRKRRPDSRTERDKLLEATFGLWKGPRRDSVALVRKWRSEWDHRGG